MLPGAVKGLIKKIVGFAPIRVPARKIFRLYVQLKYSCDRKRELVLLSDLRSLSGDTLYLLSLLENSSDKHDYCIFLKPNTTADSIAQLFPTLRKSLSYYVSRLDRYILTYYVADIRINSFFIKNSEYFLAGRFSFFTAGLSTNRTVKIESSDKEVFALFYRLSCKRRKTVLICPHSTNTQVNAPDGYWTRYAEELEKRGYVPVFNSTEKFGFFESIFLGYRETVLFAALAGNIIGVRAGLMDILLYFTNARAIIFYPSEPILSQEKFISNFWDNPTKRLMEYFSLKKIHPNKKIQECVFNNEYVFWD